jgi:hypothetical protein
MHAALRRAYSDGLYLARHNDVRVFGYGVAILGRQVIPFSNLVTTAGDQYYAKMGIAGVQPANASAPTKVTGMKLGTGSTTPTKSGSASALGTYISGSNAAFDATFPTAAAVTGTDTGWQANYQTTWAAGTATNGAIAEVVMVTDSATDATSTAANTIARAILSPAANKIAGLPMTILWHHVLLGA